MKRRGAILALPLAALVTLGGCALVEPKTSADPLSPLAECAMGHEWQLDLEDLAAQVLAMLQSDGIGVTEVTATGSQRLDWTLQGHVTIDVNYTLAAALPGPEEGQVLTVTETHDGVVAGRAYINGTVAIPRHWDMSGLDTELAATIDGVEQETVPFRFPVTVFDDELGLVTTCDGNAMSLQPRGRDLVQRWSRAG